MKALLINGSPRKGGNTEYSLSIIKDTLAEEGIDAEILQIGHESISGCLACGMCAKNKNEKCVMNDKVNEVIQKMKNADAIVLGSPVYFGGVNGTMKSFLDRAFYVSGANGNLFRHKVGASMVAVRRSGGATAFDQLNKYLLYAEMIIPTSNYWNIVHGRAPLEAKEDGEGIQSMRVLAKNMAWTLKLIEKGSDIPKPEKEAKIMTSFIK